MKHRKQRNRLRVLRAECDVSQMDLAIKVGISQSRYWRIESGYESPTDTERARLAKALRVTVDDLGFNAQAEARVS